MYNHFMIKKGFKLTKLNSSYLYLIDSPLGYQTLPSFQTLSHPKPISIVLGLNEQC